MGRTSPAPVVALVAAALLLAGCGGSLADADTPAPPRPDRTRPGDFCSAVLAGTRAAQPLAALLTRGGTVPRDQLHDGGGGRAQRVRGGAGDRAG